MRKFFVTVQLFFITLIGIPVTLAAETIPLELAEKTAKLYNWSLGVGTILALVVLIYAGFLYTTSAGNASRITDAKKWIVAGFLGLLILFGSFLLLNTINPELTNLESIILRVNEAGKFIPPKFTLPQIGGGLYEPPPPFCREACLSGGNTPSECNLLDPCPDLVCPLDGVSYVTPFGSWLACRTSGSGGVCTIGQVGQDGRPCVRDHEGNDLNGPYRAPVYAIENGFVSNAGYLNDSCGNYLLLTADQRMENGRPVTYSYQYCHLDSFTAKIQGASGNNRVRVVAGEVIAANGSTGGSPQMVDHVHFEVRKSTCSGPTTCQIYPGCYEGKINPFPIISAACPIGGSDPAGGDGDVGNVVDTLCEDAGGFCAAPATCTRVGGTINENILCPGGQGNKCCVDARIR